MRLNYLITLALAALFAVSCSKIDENSGKKPDNTTAIVAVNVTQKVLTRQSPVGAEKPTAEESKINTAKLYVFDSSNKLSKVVDLVVDPVTQTEASEKFELMLGTYSFYAAANIPSYPTVTVGDAKDIVIKKIMAITDIAQATTDNNFWMTNMDEIVSNIDAPAVMPPVGTPVKTVTIGLGRAVAKVGVDFAAPDTDVAQKDGRLTNVHYKVKNMPVQMYFLPYAVSGSWKTPFHDEAVVNPANYIHNTVGDAAYKETGVVQGAINKPCDKPSYAMENKNATPVAGNTTYLSIRGTFTPKEYADDLGAPATGDDFFRVYDIDANSYINGYYKEKTAAQAKARTLNKASVEEYKNGVSYYIVWLGNEAYTDDTDIYALKRNHHYWYTINTVTGAGEPAEDPDPKVPVVKSVLIQGNLEVIDWVMVNQEGGI